MQIGDAVQVLATLVEMKEGSCLLRCDDDREYWILEKNVSEQPKPEAPAVESAKAATTHHEPASTHHEPPHATAKK